MSERIENLIDDAKDAIAEYDPGESKIVLEKIKGSSFGYSNFPADLLIQLQLIAFQNIAEDEAISILKNNCLESFRYDIDLRGGITARLFIEPYTVRDELRKKLKKALIENQQKIGTMTIGEWISDFEAMFDVKTRELTASAEFISKHPKAVFLAPSEKIKLKELLYTYDYLLVSTLPATGQSLENLLASASSGINSPSNLHSNIAQRNETERIQGMRTESLPISIAMEKYPELGEQLITSSHIKLKVFPEPVRPSIKNWLSDYTFTVGVSNHDPIVRGNYLFKSENGRPLSTADRDKLTAILKSFEEKTPLAVNTSTKQVVFIAQERKDLPQRPAMNSGVARNNFDPAEIRRGQENNREPQRTSAPQQRFQTDEERIAAWRRDLPQKETLENGNAAGNIHFSSPQTFSTEKPAEVSRPTQNNYSPPQIAKINYSTPPRPLPRNVVDLREEER
ncbi:MAG: hypothetical protein NTY33_02430 [Candidatus Moranbacteria bacterium]|nr:hypothetical protein [Candidatus Moranbacteria bacterium]